jgi:hypothetical protein
MFRGSPNGSLPFRSHKGQSRGRIDQVLSYHTNGVSSHTTCASLRPPRGTPTLSRAGPLSQAMEPIRLLDSEIDSELSRRDASGLDFAVTLRIMCDEPAFHIHTTFLARYLFADSARTASKTEVDAFRKSHAVVTVWPYIREFVQTLTARMGFPRECLLFVMSRDRDRSRSPAVAPRYHERMDPVIRAPRGTSLRCRGRKQKAALRMCVGSQVPARK